MKTLVVVISGLFLSTAAFAQVGGSGVMSGSGASMSSGATEINEEAAPADESQGTDRRICRRVETASGSRMSYRRLCMTAAQWRSFNRTSR